MKRLDKVVNVVPIIAKADTLTIEEREHFKSRVRSPHRYFLGKLPNSSDQEILVGARPLFLSEGHFR